MSVCTYIDSYIHIYQEFGGIEFTLFSLPLPHNNTPPPLAAKRRLLVSEFAPDRYDGYVSTESIGDVGGGSEAGALGGYFVYVITHTHTHTRTHSHTHSLTHT